MSVLGIIEQSAKHAGIEVEDALQFLIHFLAHNSTVLGTAAGMAEVATGNPELVPVTQAAAAAAGNIATELESVHS